MSETSPKREHKVGPVTGYETDGTNYWVAPTYIDSWGRIHDQEVAWANVLKEVAELVAQKQVQTEAQKRELWDKLYRDLGLDKSKLYVFDRMDGKVSPVEKEEKE